MMHKYLLTISIYKLNYKCDENLRIKQRQMY